MRLAVISIAIGENFVNLSDITWPRFKSYAEKINADFIGITEKKVSITSPHWEKFQIYNYLNDYDRILYLDCDILIRKDADNLFDIVPYDQIGMFNESPFTDNRGYSIEKGSEDYNIKGFKWDGLYYNSGVMVLSKEHRFLFKKPQREIFNFFEQTYINLMVQKHEIKVFNLNYKYNRMSCLDQFIGEPRHASQFIHYAGINPDIASNIAKKDLQILDYTSKDKIWAKHIWISVEGGLGDQVQAEPTIRYLKNILHQNDDIRVTTHFPELFWHLDVIVAKHGEPIWKDIDTYPFKRITLPNPKESLWVFLSNMLCHTVDFASISVLRRTLPDDWKRYRFEYPKNKKVNILKYLKDVDINSCVLIHPGQHWENKTFPKQFWNDLVNSLIENGLIPIIIGKDEETRGVVNIEQRMGMISLVNMLDLSELMAIIDLVPVLISNDSAPIHIAGAFDNSIILIPTCKHPDHLLPWRNGSKYYKAKALYKKLICEEINSSPTEIYPVLGDGMLGKWEDYLPSIKEVTEETLKMIEAYGK